MWTTCRTFSPSDGPALPQRGRGDLRRTGQSSRRSGRWCLSSEGVRRAIVILFVVVIPVAIFGTCVYAAAHRQSLWLHYSGRLRRNIPNAVPGPCDAKAARGNPIECWSWSVGRAHGTFTRPWDEGDPLEGLYWYPPFGVTDKRYSVAWVLAIGGLAVFGLWAFASGFVLWRRGRPTFT
jgi:hypothetical protein